MRILFFSLFVAGALYSQEVQVLAVPRTPESNTVSLTLSYPKSGHVYKRNPIWMQFRVDGYALGASSGQFERSQDLSSAKEGQTVHVIIDNEPYFAVYEQPLDPFEQSGYFYNTSYRFEVPFELKEGVHTVRMFPARSYGESLKSSQTYQAIEFRVGEKNEGKEVDLQKPYLTYNEPGGRIPLYAGKPVLLDFYISNCELTPGGYCVELAIDGKEVMKLTSWQPYFLYGLKKGKHTIRLRLLNPSGEEEPGVFNDVTRTIVIQ